jgi:hypothetical protein
MGAPAFADRDLCESIEQRPVRFLAVENGPGARSGRYDLPELLVGFACYDTVAKGMFG